MLGIKRAPKNVSHRVPARGLDPGVALCAIKGASSVWETEWRRWGGTKNAVLL